MNIRRVKSCIASMFTMLLISLAGQIAAGMMSAAKADAYLELNLSCGSNCFEGGPINFLFRDTLPAWSGTDSLAGPADLYDEICYDIYLNDPSALNIINNRIHTHCAKNNGNFLVARFDVVNFSGIPNSVTLPVGQHSFSVRRTWIPNPIYSIQFSFSYVDTLYFNVKDQPSPESASSLQIVGGSPQSTRPSTAFTHPLQAGESRL